MVGFCLQFGETANMPINSGYSVLYRCLNRYCDRFCLHRTANNTLIANTSANSCRNIFPIRPRAGLCLVSDEGVRDTEYTSYLPD